MSSSFQKENNGVESFFSIKISTFNDRKKMNPHKSTWRQGPGKPQAIKPLIGISACLLGQAVRYDGRSKKAGFIIENMQNFVCWLPVCPETECGLLVPRKPMHIVSEKDKERLVEIETRIDHTGIFLAWMEKKLRNLEENKLSGYIFKSKSPSCGLHGITRHTPSGKPLGVKGPGLFAKAFTARFPGIPVADEIILANKSTIADFLERVLFFFKAEYQ